MTIRRMDHVGVVVDDLAAATAFFGELGLTVQGEGSVEGGWVDRVVGLEGVQVDFAMMETPDRSRSRRRAARAAQLELCKQRPGRERFRRPARRTGGRCEHSRSRAP